MLLGVLLGALSSVEARGDPEVEITGVTHDTRRVTPGALFCCVPGSTVDGHALAPEAVAAGAAALLVERFVDADVPQARVPDMRAAMGPVAAAFHGHPSRSMRLLGVTGTNGKTTTTWLLDAVGRAAGLVTGLIGTIETRVAGRVVPGTLTTPEATELQALLAVMRDEGAGLVAMEVSSHALAQGRVDGAEFAAAAFLNISRDHLDYHGSMDEYFEAKAALFTPDRVRAAAVHVGDPRGVDLAERCRRAGVATSTFALADPGDSDPGSPDVLADDLELLPSGSAFTLCRTESGEAVRIATPLLGRFNVLNGLAAATTALAAGIDLEAVVAGLASPIQVPGRFERVDRGQRFTVAVDYAHTPDALQSALAAARELADGRVLVVFGCGGDRDRGKRPEMGAVAAAGADAVYVTSDNPRTEEPDAIVGEILAGVPSGSTTQVDVDRRTAIRRALTDARAGDVVVVAGKGHEVGQTAGGVVTPFDDRVVVAEELEALGCG
jgi:UDP-N-acetylmuramoyl-L-alanyl-D-glutamate--2,6-diaminopimelate ligase